MLAGLPVVIFVLPALAGHPVVPGDDLTQNLPLRVLAGWQLRQGHLPLLNPYIWSGAPLLGGWNAGAAYPLTFLFAVLPPASAWTANLVVTWWAAGLGTLAFLRASRLAPVPGFLGALSFAFAGAMSAQIPHFGLVAGMSWTPLGLLALLRLSECRGARARLAWAALLAGAIGLVILAGEPRAIDDALLIIGCYAAWRAWRLRQWPAGAAYLGLVLAAVAAGLAVGAVQWLPGIEAVHGSQRVAQGAAFFDSGSLPRKWLLLLLVPDLLGGSGSLGQPAFFANYNLTEVTGYVGLMPLVAAFALLGRVRWRPLPEWLIWHLVALLGILLALGGNTPLGHLLAHLPFFDGQRLQSRNLVIADFGFAVLLAYWADQWLGAPRAGRRRNGAPAAPGGPARGRPLAGLIPGIAAVAVAAVTLAWGGGMLHWLGLSPARAATAGPLRPWLLPAVLLGGLAVALTWWGPQLAAGPRARALTWFVAADVTVFTLLAVVAVAPGAGRAGPRPAAQAAAPAAGTAPAAPVPAGALTRGGRFAVYDPGLIHGDDLRAIGAPDGNVIARTPSVEGYTSIVDARYATATGSHRATGEGQYVLSPRAIGDGTLDQLGTTVLLTPAAYLISPAGRPPAPAHRGPGSRNLPPRQPATWYFGSRLAVTSVTIPAAAAGARGIRAALLRPDGTTERLSLASGPGGTLTAALASPGQAVGIRATAGRSGAVLGPPVVGTAGGARYRAAGVLQDALVPPRWAFGGFDGPFAVFTDTLARPPLTLRADRPGATTAGAAVRAADGPGFAPASARVSSRRGVTVIRSVAGIAGWTATWQPAGGRLRQALPVRRSGLVQAVTVPAGRGTASWRYDAPGARTGLWLSLAGLALVAGAVAAAASPRRRRPAGGRSGQDAVPAAAGSASGHGSM